MLSILIELKESKINVKWDVYVKQLISIYLKAISNGIYFEAYQKSYEAFKFYLPNILKHFCSKKRRQSAQG